ncbi:AAA family ATPase [Candidatus Babeliales bacterium]|nr:AAA family ATPase [Candidatus Babeliales bacterium]
MNKNNFLYLLLLLTNSAWAASPQLGINIGGFTLNANDVATAVTKSAQVIAEATRFKRSELERKINALETQRQEIGVKRDRGQLGSAAYEQASKSVDDQIKSCRKELKNLDRRSEKTGDNVEKIITTGWQTAMDVYQKEHDRKTQIAITAANKAVENEGSLERLRFISEFATQPETLTRAGVFTVGTCVLLSVVYYGGKLTYNYAQAKLGRPTLATNSFHVTLLDRFKAFFGLTETKEQIFDDVVLSDDLKTQLHEFAQDTKKIPESKLPFRNLLLYGPPGTGKTLFAEKLAQYANMDYLFIPGGNFAQFDQGQDIVELNKLFDWADQAPNGLIIFVDEADALLHKRGPQDQHGTKVVSTFLARTGGLAEKCMFILATNNPDNLDTAVYKRMHKKINIPLPGLAERTEMVKIYLNKFATQTKTATVSSLITEEFLQTIAQQLEGFAGRDIKQIFVDIQYHVARTSDKVLTPDIITRAVQEKIAEEKISYSLHQKSLTAAAA